MSPSDGQVEGDKPRPSRRGFLTSAAGIAGAATAAAGAASARATLGGPAATVDAGVEPFFGAHQAGVATVQQGCTYFAAFDLTTAKRADVAALMGAWTTAAARLTSGLTAVELTQTPGEAPSDSGDVLGLAPFRLTITFGLGPGLFSRDGVDRYGLGAHRPAALIDLPRFASDQLVEARTGGDLCVQACADDPQVAFHAVRQLTRLGDGVAKLRWVQAGFLAGYGTKETPRNLMGFKDGTINVPITDHRSLDEYVWVGDEGGAWMRGGSYMVARPIRIALEHWDRMKLGFQEQTIGRRKQSGAALGGEHEFDGLKLDANDKDGNPVIPENAHARLAAPDSNDGAQILRRAYSYDNGVSFVAERWPPWRQGMEFDAGLLFICYQRDPRTGFVKIFDRMSKFDMMNQFVTHVGGGLFAVPPGAQHGGYIGQSLLDG